MSVNDSEGNNNAFCIISHQANNGFELVRIDSGNGCTWSAQWGVFSAKFKQKFNIDCRTLPGLRLLTMVRKSDHVRAEFDLVEFIRTATIEQITAAKTIFCVFAVGARIDALCSQIRVDMSKIQTEDRSRRTAGPASGKRMRQPKDKISAGTFRATT